MSTTFSSRDRFPSIKSLKCMVNNEVILYIKLSEFYILALFLFNS